MPTWIIFNSKCNSRTRTTMRLKRRIRRMTIIKQTTMKMDLSHQTQLSDSRTVVSSSRSLVLIRATSMLCSRDPSSSLARIALTSRLIRISRSWSSSDSHSVLLPRRTRALALNSNPMLAKWICKQLNRSSRKMPQISSDFSSLARKLVTSVSNLQLDLRMTTTTCKAQSLS